MNQNNFTVCLFNEKTTVPYIRKSLRNVEHIGRGYSANDIIVTGTIHVSSKKDCDKLIEFVRTIKECFKNESKEST